MDIDQLNSRYGIAQQVSFERGAGGFPFIRINNRKASALISLYGGQVLSFKPTHTGIDMLFVSGKSVYEAGSAIRGGIPVCWPWFGPDPKGLFRPNHGFVRNQLWQVLDTTSAEQETVVRLRIDEHRVNQRHWTQPFQLTLEARIGVELTLTLTTHNTGSQPFSLTQAFHNYFKIGDITQIQVLGLENSLYFDKLDQGREKRQNGVVRINQETDRIYENIPSRLSLIDPSYQRRIEIESQHCKTGVVWNPWQKAMHDLDEEDYQRFVCVETGNIAFDLLQVLPGQQRSLISTYTVLAL